MDRLQTSGFSARGRLQAGVPRNTAAIEGPAELVVFSDDWGRHPSSCQHLIRALLPRFPVVWVNTIGTRTPRLDRLTARRALGKLSAWARRPDVGRNEGNPRVLEPLMWPTFGTRFGRRLNRALMKRSLERAGSDAQRRIVVSTIPLVADLVGRIDVDRWVYYCVDDLEKWPGLDASSLRRMERRMIDRVDCIVAVSEVLVAKLAARGRSASLLTHGVDLDHWRPPQHEAAPLLAGCETPIIAFWGVVDRRLNLEWVRRLSERLPAGTIVLAGPENDPDDRLRQLPRVVLTGPLPYVDLPALAQAAAVLVMPYADTPATRAIQPLKLKEYLATGKPVVASALPAVAEWIEACDVADGPADFARRVVARVASGVPARQLAARSRLEEESWADKAQTFERLLRGRTAA